MSDLADELTSVGDYLRLAATRFAEADLVFGHGTDNAWDEAVALLSATLNIPWDRLPFVADARLLRGERGELLERIRQRIEDRLPLPYITGQAWFAGHQFYVDRRTLIPRSPIGELIGQQLSPWLAGEPRRIADLCCGSGCIGISAALAFPGAAVDLIDISKDALAVAERNVDQFGLAERVRLIESDLLPENNRYDVILANPPYVDAAEMASLPAEFRHEPALGLDGGEDGLDLVDRMLIQAGSVLSDSGILIGEAGNAAALLPSRYPDLPFMWPEFEQGGHGVFVLEASALRQMKARA